MTKKGSLDFLLLIYYIESRRRLQPKKILQGEGIWMIFKFAFIEFKSENYLSHCHSTNYFAEKQVVKM